MTTAHEKILHLETKDLSNRNHIESYVAKNMELLQDMNTIRSELNDKDSSLTHLKEQLQVQASKTENQDQFTEPISALKRASLKYFKIQFKPFITYRGFKYAPILGSEKVCYKNHTFYNLTKADKNVL